MSLLWKMRFIIRTYWKQYLFAFLCLQLVAVLNQLPPWLIGWVVDEITTDSLYPEELGLAIGGILVTAFLIYGFRFLWRSLLYGASVDIVREQRDQLFAHFTRMSPSFYQRHTTGDLMAHATNDLNAVEACVGDGIMTLVDSIIAGVTVLVAMVVLVSGKLTLMVLVPFPALAWITSRYGTQMHKHFGQAQARFSDLNEEARETVAGIRAVRAHQLNKRQSERFFQQSRRTVEANRSVGHVEALFMPSVNIFFGLAFVIALMGGAWLIQDGEMTIGMLTTFTLYLGQLLWPMMQLGWQFSLFQRGSASWKRLERLMSVTPDIADKPDAVPAPTRHDLHFDIQAFAYPEAFPAESEELNPARTVLENIRLSVGSGQFVGITGRTGSGKSSLFRLLLREFNLPEDSSITLGGNNIDNIQLQALRSQIAWVPQVATLFTGTIASNIAFYNINASQTDIEKAARLAAIHDEIMAFQDGYNTLLGENGISLSGGQKQRIALARAFLADHPILLLDDAFSALDMKTEATILKNLHALHGHKTVLLITQRLPELIRADQILVLEDGRILEQGTHQQLLEHAGWYARIFRQQARSLELQPLVAVESEKAVSPVQEAP
ncbi:ABC transporter ATP-binding protein [Parendozoicomonas haliclonae]|uniref:Multidrug resistance-like ATP-binding protein MdlA n=1 Tax=Parendozoicomonas haliclonae TaxID=1960125 RepID=A0A1X7ATF2_9GAMM|nr:ABC transporter transmembrane domain-containing protein [Parendozoicomonas haliclonae]SMA50697.1 putative multidrug resistance ABC transporter ATP-binding/permease protein YheI [Parendozoicomonas haliclonae]